MLITEPDPELDLVLERMVPLRPEQVWAAWTRPEHLTHWFTPAPWTTPEAEIDARPGGIFRTVMCSPDGERSEGAGCVLAAVEHRLLVWTNTLGPGGRPNEIGSGDGEFGFTAVITMEPSGDDATFYGARVIHATAAACAAHAAMGFHDGWGAALDQLVAHMTTS
ncbi:MAG: SRPBCC domain-containing protein [Ilumatobacteraceae bacterium]